MSFSFKKMHTPTSYAARTDVGNVREHNEDSYMAKSPLFVVADGMGGHEAGEVASKIAVDTMAAHAPKGPNPEALADAVIEANAAVLRGAQNGTGKPGMGTTLTAVTVFDDEVTVAQVGDSRAYLLHDGALQRITRDHSLMAELIEQGRLTEEEARFHPQRSVITRALGSDPNMQPDTFTLQVEDGDRLMLCSDGLSSMVADDIIEAIMRQHVGPAQACDALVNEALASGGLDNVTVVIIDPLGDPFEEAAGNMEEFVEVSLTEDVAREPVAPTRVEIDAPSRHETSKAKRKAKAKHSREKGKRAPLIWALAFIVILVAAGIGFYAYAQNSFYLITNDGVVSVYRGLPGKIGDLSVSWLEEEASDIDVSKLNPTTQNRLANGISVNSLDEAQDLLAEYRQTVASAQRMHNNAASSSSGAGSSSSTPSQPSEQG